MNGFVTGAVHMGPAGTSLPKSLRDPLDEDLRTLGYLSEDGVSIQTISTKRGNRFKYTEAHFTVLGEVDPGGLTQRRSLLDRILVALRLKRPPGNSWAFQIKDGGRHVIMTIPRGAVSDIGDVVYSRGEVLATNLVVRTWPDRGGNSIYIFTEDGPVESSASTDR